MINTGCHSFKGEYSSEHYDTITDSQKSYDKNEDYDDEEDKNKKQPTNYQCATPNPIASKAKA